mmetsp:Transcript_23496/g.29179  ORF Transcript_23496/g.29179 Transcript_23496/m.29179 type:complete len:81 (-) Transcript_23496:55-297(-)
MDSEGSNIDSPSTVGAIVAKRSQKAPAAAGPDRDDDRLMQLMDKKFSKFEKLITNIASSMGELRGEVSYMKGKLSDAKLL